MINLMKKAAFSIVVILLGASIVLPFFAQASAKLEINFFYSETCPHCKAENTFLDKIEPEYPDVVINRYLITDISHRQLLIDSLKEHGAEKDLGLVPITFIGKDMILGFDTEDNIGKQIEESIRAQLNNIDNAQKDKDVVNLPLIGRVDLTKYSLSLQAIILGFFDGFNVCSLGALVLILGLVLILKSRPKIILFGGLYILVTAIIYGVLIFLWYQLFYYLGPLIPIMNVFVGVLGIGGAIYFLRQFLKSRKVDLTCDSQGNPIVMKHSEKIQKAFRESGKIWGMIIGVLIFASVITIVEFPCSAVIPVLFAGIMAHANIPILVYIANLLLYLFFYMLDEIAVFLIAVFTMNIKIASGKSMKWLSLIEAIVLFALGLYYLISVF